MQNWHCQGQVHYNVNCLHIKTTVYQCYIFSITFDYGAEAWSHMLQNRIVVPEIWCLRRIWKQNITNHVILNKLNTDRNFLQTVSQRKRRYFGHVKRQNSFLNILGGEIYVINSVIIDNVLRNFVRL